MKIQLFRLFISHFDCNIDKNFDLRHLRQIKVLDQISQLLKLLYLLRKYFLFSLKWKDV
jgi:hypothetical protein